MLSHHDGRLRGCTTINGFLFLFPFQMCHPWLKTMVGIKCSGWKTDSHPLIWSGSDAVRMQPWQTANAFGGKTKENKSKQFSVSRFLTLSLSHTDRHTHTHKARGGASMLWISNSRCGKLLKFPDSAAFSRNPTGKCKIHVKKTIYAVFLWQLSNLKRRKN